MMHGRRHKKIRFYAADVHETPLQVLNKAGTDKFDGSVRSPELITPRGLLLSCTEMVVPPLSMVSTRLVVRRPIRTSREMFDELEFNRSTSIGFSDRIWYAIEHQRFACHVVPCHVIKLTNKDVI